MRLRVDGRTVEAAAGATLLEAAAGAGVTIPTLCHDGRLSPAAACRLCLVRVDGAPRLVPACTTPATDGLVVETRNPALNSYRRFVRRALARRTGTPTPALRGPRPDRGHPFLRVDMTKCILCFRCVRICAEVEGRGIWRVEGRGAATRIAPGPAPTLLASGCSSCGACADTCPTGAITDARPRGFARPRAWTRTVCGYCGVGCETLVGTARGRVATVRPVPHAPVNRGHLCVKGRYAFGFLRAHDRVVSPMIRRGGRWERASWPDALGAAADGLRRALARGGPGAVGVLGSARGTNEENYLAGKFARVVLGTNNADNCARVCHAPSAAALKAALGTGAATNSLADLDRTAVILVAGANPTEAHPVAGARIRAAVRRGATLIVVDPRRTELAALAAVHVPLRPGGNVPLFNAIAAEIMRTGGEDGAFIAARTTGFADWRASVAAWTPERAAPLCGVAPAVIRAAARAYASARPAMAFWGLGLTEHTQGTGAVTGLINLALLTGNVGIPGAGLNPLRGQNNVQGASHMGCDPGVLAGAEPLAAGRPRFAAAWGAPIPEAPGLTATAMLEAARTGTLRSLVVIGWDLLQSGAGERRTREALARLDHLVVVDLFLNEGARAAQVFLPAASWLEKDGTFMNGERRIQRVRRAVPPPPGVRTDGEILCGLAAALGHRRGFSFRSTRAIWDEVRGLWPGAAGVTYARLEREGGLQWPCPDTRHPGTPVLYADDPSWRGAFRAVEFAPTPEAVSPEFPLLLITGRSLAQYNAGSQTRRTPARRLRGADLLDLAPADAAALAVRSGDRVRVASRWGEAILSARVTDTMKPGEVFTTFAFPGAHVNRLTGPHADAVTATPEYKVTAVSLARA